MKVMYRTGDFSGFIVKRDVLRTTDRFVFYAGFSGRELREAKNSAFSAWFETFQDAKSHLIAAKERQINGLQRQLEAVRKDLVEIQNLSESP